MVTIIPGMATTIPGMVTTLPGGQLEVVTFTPESVVTFDWNGWSPCPGIRTSDDLVEPSAL